MPPATPSRADVERLRAISSFPQLLNYLRDELDWPIEIDDVEEITFEYSPEELGLDAKTAVKIKHIRQLRPLASSQPWGIFFVEFEPKKLPVVVLRRVLQKLILDRRGQARSSERQAWKLHDLLFISSFGERDERSLTFAHFADAPSGHPDDLPTLKVLGWDTDDTVLHLDKVDRDLKAHLRWPADDKQTDEWRRQWSKAFTLSHRYVITTSKDLALRLAELAVKIRAKANQVLRVESSTGPLRKLQKAFQQALIHDLDDDGFADLYAQTISYGLLSARIMEGPKATADSLADRIPITNPFLKELLQSFLKAGGRAGRSGKGGIDFDELDVGDIVDLLNSSTTNMEAVLRDFGNKNPLEDPVIHFYELFLKEYDPKKRMQRGVFYTPRPVVSFIVRSVHEILQKEFGLEDGLADTATWADMVKRNPELKLPEIEVKDEKTGKVSKRPSDAAGDFVQILDPATGTGTFLVEVIDVIHKALVDRWTREKKTKSEITRLWNEYVPAHLLPRLHGYELMPAPYAIAHMKIGLKLHETGYGFGSEERVRVYLTNALEPAQNFSDRLAFEVPALAHEAQAVSTVKKRQRFTVVVGNPPYSVLSANLSASARSLVDEYRSVSGEPIVERSMLRLEMHLQDDYIKFFRFGQQAILQADCGVLGLITNSGYLDALSLRGMRWSLASTFASIRVVDLHGSQQRATAASRAVQDQNVFDIVQGVSIFFGERRMSSASTALLHVELTRSRDDKYQWLDTNCLPSVKWNRFVPVHPTFFFVPKDAEVAEEFHLGIPLTELFPDNITGMVTAHDHLVVDFDDEQLKRIARELRDRSLSDEVVRERWSIKDNAGWKLSVARARLRQTDDATGWYQDLDYRPFDRRRINYHPALVWSDRRRLMQHLLDGPNVSLVACRQLSARPWQHVFVCSSLVESATVSNKSREICYVFPVWHYAHLKAQSPRQARQPNLHERLWACLDTEGASPSDPCDALHLTYAELHSPSYRTRYVELLEKEFPRVFAPRDPALRDALIALGRDLVALHLLRADYPFATWNASGAAKPNPLGRAISTLHSSGDLGVRKAGEKGKAMAPCSKGSEFGRVYFNETAYFDGVPKAVWHFQIGAYQVCEKWLKDRKGRTLSKDDIEHYQKIIVALSETIRIMAEIDKVIDAHGGWPGAFVTTPTTPTTPSSPSTPSTPASDAPQGATSQPPGAGGSGTDAPGEAPRPLA
jgi:hypothetical protein